MTESTSESQIKSLLRDHSRGFTISDIAAHVGLNRNATAKHLEVLQATGQVESSLYGTAKVYTLARRVPASALLDLASDMVCTIDDQNLLSFANQNVLSFLGCRRR